ncbi:hypothetical protein MKX01_012941 [Papaver californicum]|nr:hypothetical protein MKX01_012941 [Papaver californicum]
MNQVNIVCSCFHFVFFIASILTYKIYSLIIREREISKAKNSIHAMAMALDINPTIATLELFFLSVAKEFSERNDIKKHMKKVTVLDDEEVCSVCLLDMNGGGGDGDGAVVLKCSHAFHEKCILEWSKRKLNCPLCRHEIWRDYVKKT